MPLSRYTLSRVLLVRSPILVDAARRWSTASQTRARRNAMVALTSLTERRKEREDAEAYFEAIEQPDPELVVPRSRRSADGS